MRLSTTTGAGLGSVTAPPVPLSAAQQQLFFLHRLEPQSSSYNESILWRLQGPLDVPAARKAVDLIVERHSVFRTRFVEVDGEPAQIVERDGGVACRVEAAD